MSLTMIKLEPDMGRLIRWAEKEKLLGTWREDDLGYALHALFAAVFSPLVPKPFALIREPNRAAAILAYSVASLAALREQAQSFAAPDSAAAIGLDSLAGKTMPDHWEPGRRLGFQVRVRPMLRTDREGDRTRTREVDAFVLSSQNSDRGAVYEAWLQAHLPGATIERAKLDSFRLSSVRRRGRPEGSETGRPFKIQNGPDATFSGVLTVRDDANFAASLARGVGRHRTFGFGMLLLRPAS